MGFTLSKHMFGLKFNFFHTYTLHTCFRVHSPYSYLVYTLQAHVRFKIFKFSWEFFFHTYTLHTCSRIHSPYSYFVYTLQAHVRFKIFKFSQEIIFFILTLSTHISGFTLHTVIWFTLSKYMLGSKFSNFHERSFFHAYTLHTCFRVHSPYSYLVYTLQAHVRFKIFEFSKKLIFFILTLSTHVSGFTLHTVIWFTLSKHMLGLKFSNFLRRSFFHAYTLSKQMLHFKILYSYYNFIMCLNAPFNHECLTP